MAQTVPASRTIFSIGPVVIIGPSAVLSALFRCALGKLCGRRWHLRMWYMCGEITKKLVAPFAVHFKATTE